MEFVENLNLEFPWKIATTLFQANLRVVTSGEILPSRFKYVLVSSIGHPAIDLISSMRSIQESMGIPHKIKQEVLDKWYSADLPQYYSISIFDEEWNAQHGAIILIEYNIDKYLGALRVGNGSNILPRDKAVGTIVAISIGDSDIEYAVYALKTILSSTMLICNFSSDDDKLKQIFDRVGVVQLGNPIHVK